MGKSIVDWIREGEEVHKIAEREYHQLTIQLRELTAQWRSKQAELNHIAAFLGKPLLPEQPVEETPSSVFSTAFRSASGGSANGKNGHRLNIATANLQPFTAPLSTEWNGENLPKLPVTK